MTIKRDETWKQEDGTYKCPICDKIYSRARICSHIFRSHTEKGIKHKPMDIFVANGGTIFTWNKGLTKETDIRIRKSIECLREGIKSGRIIPSQLGKPISEEVKLKISNKMKLVHKEGRAWNIGKSRWNNKPSYPETFFMKVINNEFEDKQYQKEFNVSIYSIDFAWEHKKLAIEIDGAQHQRFQVCIDRDIRKDKCLIENGWKVLRIKWKDMFNNSQYWIKTAKEFIGK